MSIGSVLIQPQKIRRATGETGDAALVDDALSLGTRLLVDSSQGGRLLETITEAVQAVGKRMQNQVSPNLNQARQHLQAWIQPTINFLESLSANPPAIDNPSSGLELLQQVLLQLSTLAQHLTLDQLRKQVGILLEVLQNDLGITSNFIEEQIWLFVDDLIRQLDQMPPELDLTAQGNRLGMISLLRRVKRRLKGEFAFPLLETEAIANSLLELIRSTGIETLAKKAACITAGLSEGVEIGQTLLELVPFATTSPLTPNFATPRTAIASTRFISNLAAIATPLDANTATDPYKYCWYASWLLGSKDRTGGNILSALPLPWMPDPYADIWIETETGKVKIATLFGGGEEDFKNPKTQAIYPPGTFADWTKLPQFNDTFKSSGEGPYYTFKHTSKEGMENWAYHLGWIADAVKVTLNITSIEEGDWLSNLFNALFYTGQGTFKFFAEKPLNWWLPVVAFRNSRQPWWLLSRAPFATVGGSFQGFHTKADSGNAFVYWLAGLLLQDGLEAYLLNATGNSLRDAFLSFLTLRNYEGPLRHEPFPDDRPDDRPENRKEIDGIANLFVTLAVTQIMVKSVPRKDYCHPFFQEKGHAARMWLLWALLAGTGFAFLGALVGTIIAETIAWAEDFEVLGWKMLTSIPTVFFSFFPSLYLGREGDTDNGTYNPKGPAFAGYPKPEDVPNSPYKLPYEAGKSVQCVQGNQGFWSHNYISDPPDNPNFTPQIYAYDFALDQDEEILASRPGTVVDYFDWVPNNTDPDLNPDNDDDKKKLADIIAEAANSGALRAGQTTIDSWNFILIRHDLDDNGNLNPDNNPVPPMAKFDLDQGGAIATTYGVYGHGRKGSVRELFKNRGILANQIIGQRVKRGQPIMRAGNTGRSAYNHLHMDIRPGPAAPVANPPPALPPAPATIAPVARGGLATRTIPFVFREVKSRLEINSFRSNPDGVPTSLNYYTSENQKVT